MGRLRYVAVAVVLLAAACGGDDALSMEEYYAAVEAETARYDQATDDISNALNAQFESAITEVTDAAAGADDATLETLVAELTETAVAATSAAFRLTGEQLDQFIATMDPLEPPDEVAAEHDEAVAALRASRAAIDPTIESIKGVTTMEELDPVLAGSAFADSRRRLEASCRALEQAGNDNGLDVDLDCPGDDQPQSP